MKKIVSIALVGCLAAGLAAAPWILRGAEPAKTTADKPADKVADKPADKVVYDGPEQFPNLSDLRDPAFDRYVDMGLLGQAWQGQDAAGLTDAALQLGEGERVLLRSHKSGLTAEKLLGLAAKLAADQKDKAALDRLAKAAEARGDKKLVAQVGSARKLADAARDLDPALLLSADTTTTQEFNLFRSYLKDVRNAKLTGDVVTLEAIEMELPNQKPLAPERRDYLARLTKESRSALPAADPDARKTTDALAKLGGVSRDIWGDLGNAGAELDQRRLQAGNDASNDAAKWDQHRLGFNQRPPEANSAATWQNEGDAPQNGGYLTQPTAPPRRKPDPIQRDFTFNNTCSFPVRVQYLPGGKPWSVPANSHWNQRWISGNGTAPSIQLLATGQSYWLENNGHYQLYQGPGGTVAWGTAP